VFVAVLGGHWVEQARDGEFIDEVDISDVADRLGSPANGDVATGASRGTANGQGAGSDERAARIRSPS